MKKKMKIGWGTLKVVHILIFELLPFLSLKGHYLFHSNRNYI